MNPDSLGGIDGIFDRDLLEDLLRIVDREEMKTSAAAQYFGRDGLLKEIHRMVIEAIRAQAACIGQAEGLTVDLSRIDSRRLRAEACVPRAKRVQAARGRR